MIMTSVVMFIIPLLNHATQAAPSQPSFYPGPSLNLAVGGPAMKHFRRSTPTSQCSCPDKRTLLDIIWSCITTVLICTWVTVHLNIAPESERKWRGILRRVKVMFWGLIAPELIVAWALRQWMTSRRIAKENSHRGWTQAHGFLFVMGGVSLMKGDEDLGTLSYAVFTDLLRAGDIDFPMISVQDITEKSKGDPLSKFLAILQTTWFIVQCISRAALGLAITELEIVTLAFCSLNAITYFCWWHKPLDIERRVPIYLKPESTYRPTIPAVEENAAQPDVPAPEDKADDKSGVIAKVETGEMTSPTVPPPILPHTNTTTTSSIRNAISCLIFRLRDAVRRDLEYYNIFVLFLLVYPIGRPLRIILFFLGHIFETYMVGIMAAMIGSEESEKVAPGVKRVNTFYSPKLTAKDEILMCTLYCIIGCAFGALHCIAWSFHFPTSAERSIWRAMSLIITFIPITGVLMFYCSSLREDEDGEYRLHTQNKFLRGLEMTVLMLAVLITGFYIPCRMILLLQSFISLRSVPPSVYLAFNWQNYLPHL